MPDIAVSRQPSRHDRTGTSHQPSRSNSHAAHTHTLRPSRSSEAPEVYDPSRGVVESVSGSRSRRTGSNKGPRRPVQPVGVCPPGWI